MRRATIALFATTFVTGCAAVGSIDPYAATCSDTGDLSGLDSVAKALVEEIQPRGDNDMARGEIARMLSQECEGKSLDYKPGRAVEKTARRELRPEAGAR
jgi:hypothetical protein